MHTKKECNLLIVGTGIYCFTAANIVKQKGKRCLVINVHPFELR